MYATATMGAILVPLNPSYQAAEISHALQHCKAKMLVAASSCKGTDLIHTVLTATGHSTKRECKLSDHTLEHVLVLSAPTAGKQVDVAVKANFL